MNIKKIEFASREKILKEISSFSDSKKKKALSVVESYPEDEDIDFSFANVCGCMAIRAFDMGRYSFVFPYELTEGADVCRAVSQIVRYCMLEELEPVFVGVPSDRMSVFFELGYRHADIDAESPDSSTYRVSLKSECMMLSDFPEADCEAISLQPLDEGDISDYARLVRDRENNKYWGYDPFIDYPDASDELLFDIAKREFEYSSAIILAVKKNGAFIGEASFHCFDFKGGADISVRILPEHQRKGYGGQVLSLLFEIAAEIGLVAVCARVDNANVASLSLFSRDADEEENDGHETVYTYRLYE